MGDANEINQPSRTNWQFWIPILLWAFVVALGIIKVFIDTPLEEITFIIIVDTINSNTFSTFLSIILCMFNQYFSIKKEELKEQQSGLCMKNIPGTIIATIIWGVVAIFDTSLPYDWMVWVFLVCNVIYVACFFFVFRAKQRS